MKKLIGIYDYTVVLTYLGLMFALLGVLHSLRGWILGALLLLGLSLTCDTFDGRVARAKKNRTDMESQFGVQIDSLCDMVSFGVFPAILCTGMGMDSFPDHCLLAFYCLCCVIRLAYFNVLAQHKTENTPAVFHGLPVVVLPTFLPLAYLAHLCLPGQWVHWLLRVMVVGFGILYIWDFTFQKPKLWQQVLFGCVYIVPMILVFVMTWILR